VTLYLRVRAVRLLLLAVLVTIGGVALPVAMLPITAGPVGATVALGFVLALIVPLTAAWACSRGNAELERVAVRNVARADLAFVVGAIVVTACATAALEAGAASAIGLLVARAILTFGGLLLAGWWLAGWDTAAVAPTLYFLAVAVAGRGEDIAHPAPWAWIAADGGDLPAWIAGTSVFVIGLALAHLRSQASR
jgi:hypothetical protein